MKPVVRYTIFDFDEGKRVQRADGKGVAYMTYGEACELWWNNKDTKAFSPRDGITRRYGMPLEHVVMED